MDYENSYLELGEYAHDLIRCKAHSLVGKGGFTLSDCDDIEQELALDLLARMKHFDPRKGKRITFMARIIEHRMASLLEERHAMCRDWRCCLESLDDPALQEPPEGASRAENMPDPGRLIREDLSYEMDIPKVVASFPPELRELWDGLLKSSVKQVSRKTGVPRSTIYYRMDVMRKIFQNAGF